MVKDGKDLDRGHNIVVSKNRSLDRSLMGNAQK